MYGLETIRQMNDIKTKEAKKDNKIPFVISSETDKENLNKIPFLADYIPKGWKLINTFFVDSSGFGKEHERALTFDKFKSITKLNHGYAITEAGQFQVYIGEFIRI